MADYNSNPDMTDGDQLIQGDAFKKGGGVHMKDGGDPPVGFYNPNIARQGAKARANAANRDVNTLPDPKTYAFVQGLLGNRPDEMGFSVMHPESENIRKAGEVGFAIGTGLSVMPALKPLQAGATKVGMAAEKALQKPVTDILQRGGKGAELLSSFATQPAQVVKEKGGNWLKGDVERAVAPLKVKHEYNTRTLDPAEHLQELDKWTPELIAKQSKTAPRLPIAIEEERQALKPKVAINNWIDQKLNKYIKNEMGTPEDPIRALAEQGITHLPPDTRLPPNYSSVQATRREAGFPEEGMGQSDLAKVWEGWADKPIGFATTGEAMNVGKGEPWMEKVDPFTRVHGIAANWGRHIHSDLGFDHIIDVLKGDLASGRITPEQLNKISMPQAVQRTHEYNQDMARKMAEAQIKNTEGMPVHKEYPEGYKWIELAPKEVKSKDDLGDLGLQAYFDYMKSGGDEAYALKAGQKADAQKYLADALKYEGDTMGHCVGGYCPDVVEGKSRIYSLRDKKGEPHVTVEVKPQAVATWQDAKAKGGDPLAMQTEAKRRMGLDSPEAEKEAVKNADGDQRYEMNRQLEKHFTDIYKEQFGDLPQSIVQIKGKQNAAPKEEYLPFVQDFVKSGDWSDVGDISNTGLVRIYPESELAQTLSKKGLPVPKYASQDEVSELLKQAEVGSYRDASKGITWINDEHPDYKTDTPPAEGMKHGGKVHFAGNTENMKRELMLKDQHYQVGGIVRGVEELSQAYKAAKAAKDMKTAETVAKLMRAPEKSTEELRAIAQRMAPQIIGEEFVRGEKGTKSIAGKTQKQFAREKEIQHDIQPTVDRPEPAPVDFEKLKGSVMVGIPGDPTISGQELRSVAGSPLQTPSPQHGGPLYGLGRPDESFWASGQDAANKVQNLVHRSSQLHDAPVVGNYIMMGPESINYAQHFADANLSAIDPTKMSKRQIEEFNNLVREGYPYKKNDQHFQRVFPSFPGIENPDEAYLHFIVDPEMRKHFNSLMQMPTVTQKYNLPSGIDVRHAITEPELRNVESGVTGKALGQMNPDVKELSLSEHPTYSHNIPGKFLGSTDVPYPYELTFPDMVKSIRENPKQAPYEFGTLQYSGPSQIIDPQLIDELSKYREFIKQYTGKKKGGAVDKSELITVKRKRK